MVAGRFVFHVVKKIKNGNVSRRELFFKMAKFNVSMPCIIESQQKYSDRLVIHEVPNNMNYKANLVAGKEDSKHSKTNGLKDKVTVLPKDTLMEILALHCITMSKDGDGSMPGRVIEDTYKEELSVQCGDYGEVEEADIEVKEKVGNNSKNVADNKDPITIKSESLLKPTWLNGVVFS
ncbi:hypothetical protein L2E82_24796 [Cichorium intybus]|uniref:Uncharacterized protein n=1 Tax=Cichorium intybus TaxID=13427 RepID=A0ACB9E1E3_CICIN|nr:hypothetical protein L2E82_24796 [Cichorium intybus]